MRLCLFLGATLLAAATTALAACSTTSNPGSLGNGNGNGAPAEVPADAGLQDGSTDADLAFFTGGANGGEMTGEQAVTYRGCPKCHGNDMAGSAGPLTPPAGSNWPAGDMLYPPNLTPDMATGIGSWSDLQLQTAIQEGVDNNGLRLCPEMKHYLTMSDTEVAAIISYLRALPAVSKTIPGSICPPLKGGS